MLRPTGFAILIWRCSAKVQRMLDSKNGVVHFRVPGTLKQSNKLGATTYRAAIEVFAIANSEGDRRPTKIQRMEQITCIGAHSACE